MKVSENDLQKYMRVWELMKMVPLSDAQITEYIVLCEQGYRYIALFCSNEKCNGEFEAVIMNNEEWMEHSKHVDSSYDMSEDS